MLRKINLGKIKFKRGISLMVSYVLLISISLIISIGVYAWWSSFQIPTKIDCDEGTSVILEDIDCSDALTSGIIKLTIKIMEILM